MGGVVVVGGGGGVKSHVPHQSCCFLLTVLAKLYYSVHISALVYTSVSQSIFSRILSERFSVCHFYR